MDASAVSLLVDVPMPVGKQREKIRDARLDEQGAERRNQMRICHTLQTAEKEIARLRKLLTGDMTDTSTAPSTARPLPATCGSTDKLADVHRTLSEAITTFPMKLVSRESVEPVVLDKASAEGLVGKLRWCVSQVEWVMCHVSAESRGQRGPLTQIQWGRRPLPGPLQWDRRCRGREASSCVAWSSLWP